MSKYYLLIICCIFITQLKAQTPTVVIEEDYTNPDKRLYTASDEYIKKTIENGLYIAKAGRLPAGLDFGFRYDPYNNPQDKNDAKEASDIEFTIIKLKGKGESFISVGINYVYLRLSYNALGQWKLTDYYNNKVYQEGTASINPDTNKVMLSHRGDRIRFYINDKEVARYTFESNQSWEKFMRWENLSVFTSDPKMVLALDKVVLKGYQTGTKYPDEIAQDLIAEQAKKKLEAKKAMSETYMLYGFIDWKTKKYGFRDADNKIVVPAIYDAIAEEGFKEGLAGVELNKKWGFIDKLGNVVVELKYDYLTSFKNGFAVVVSDKKYGVINKSGKEVITPKYALIRNNDFVKDEAIAEGMVIVQGMGRYGFADTNGVEIVTPKYNEAKKFSCGLAAVNLNGKWGFIDKAGKEVVPLKYDGVENYSEGFCAVNIGAKIEDGYPKGGKWGFIDRTGKPITQNIYYFVSDFSEGLAKVVLKEGDPAQFIDTTGKVVLIPKYDMIEDFSEGLAQVYIDKGDVILNGFIDKTGKEIIPLRSDIMFTHVGFSEGLIGVEAEDNLKGYMDKTGKLIIPYTYKSVEPFKDGKAKVKLEDDREFYIDKYGNKLD